MLFTSWLFQRIVPPVLPFALGSLGFLTNFDFADYTAVMDNAIENGIRVNLRMRFTCTVYRAIAPEPGKGRRAVKKADTGEILMKNLEEGGWEALEGGWSANEALNNGKEGKKSKKDKEIMCFSTRPVESFEVLNDLVVDRGPSPYMSLLELFGTYPLLQMFFFYCHLDSTSTNCIRLVMSNVLGTGLGVLHDDLYLVVFGISTRTSQSINSIRDWDISFICFLVEFIRFVN